MELVVEDTVLLTVGESERGTGSASIGESERPRISFERSGPQWTLDVSIPLASNHGFVRTREDVTTSRAAMINAAFRVGALGIGCWAAFCGLAWGAAAWRRARGGLRGRDGAAADVSFGSDRISVLQVDRRAKSARLNGTPVRLSPKQFALLSLLASDEGRVFSDDAILHVVWPGSRYADSNDLRQCVYQLRRRLDAVVPGGARHVCNAKGFGYRLAAQLPIAADAPPEEEEERHALCERI